MSVGSVEALARAAFKRLLPPARRGAILFLAGAALLGACSENSGPDGNEPVPPVPDYLIERGPAGSGSVVGWALMSFLPHPDSLVHEARYALPGDPFESRVEIRHERAGDGYVHDWRRGPEDGPWIETRFAEETDGSWSWLLTGWGDLDLRRNLVEAGSHPLPVDPLSPLSYALLGWRWEEAGKPASLDLDLLFMDSEAAELAPRILSASLVYGGESDAGGIPVLAFELQLDEGSLFFKLWSEHFPLPFNTWWEQRALALRFWPGLIDLSVLEFDPDFPAPDGYTVSSFDLSAGNLTLAAEAFIPAGEGPFPGVLLVSDAGPADRDDAAVFGYLAHNLARAGYFVLRYDKPGTGMSGGLLDSLDLDGRRLALAAAWNALRDASAVDAFRCALVGHGEGGALALEFAANDPDVAAVIALASALYDPSFLPVIPEAVEAPGDWIEALGRQCFVDKYRDLLAFDSGEFLSDPAWSGRPALLYRGDMDTRVEWAELEDQGTLLEGAGARVHWKHWANLDHYLNAGRDDAPPSTELVDSLLLWLATEISLR